jgi:3-hydroxyisobutyrate dehydrogenase
VDVLLSILPDAHAVEEVVRGPAGTLTAVAPDTVHIEMSTIDARRKARLRNAMRAAGGDLLDCPISGSPAMVANRQAVTFVSGDPARVEAVRAVLDAISGRWVYAGGFGAGTSLKYVADLLVAAHTVAAAEALVLAARLGLNTDLVQRALDDSIAGSVVWKQRGPLMRSRKWSPAQAPISMLHAVLDQIADASRGVGVDTPVFTAARSVFAKAAAEGWGELDIAAVCDQIAGSRGTRPGHPLA